MTRPGFGAGKDKGLVFRNWNSENRKSPVIQGQPSRPVPPEKNHIDFVAMDD